jgi:hypothetical protein
VGAVVFVGAVGAGVASNVFRVESKATTASSSTLVMPTQPVARPAATPAQNAFGSSPPPSDSASYPLLATVNASSLPKAATPPVAPPPVQPSRRAPWPTTPGQKPKKPDAPDDSSDTDTSPAPTQAVAPPAPPPPPPVPAVDTPPPTPPPAAVSNKPKGVDDGF